MSDQDLGRRFQVNRRVKKPPPPLSATLPSHACGRRVRNTISLRRLSKSSRSVETLKRCSSEPQLWRGGASDCHPDRDHHRCSTPAEIAGVFFRPKTCTDFFRSSSDYSLVPRSPLKSFEGYNKDAKVVVNVTVDGSPGPIRSMVRLGSSVEEAINLFIQKYSEEGRTPRLDTDATSTFELHHSYFSLQSLNRCDAIGDAGSRSFYLRKGSSHWGSNTSLNSGYMSDKITGGITNQPPSDPLVLLPDLIAAKLRKFIRRTHKLCRFLICIQCSR